MTKPKVLFVLSSCSSFDEGGKPHPTGWYLPEFAHPYNQVSPHADIVIASPKGGEAPLDPNSVEMFKSDAESVDFLKTQSALWKETAKLGDFTGKTDQFAAIFYVGGHGPMFDLATDETSHALIREFWESGKVVGAVCHGPIALANVKLSDGSFLVDGSAVTGFTNAEEDQVKLSEYMPFMLEDVLKKNGGKFEKADEPWGEKVVVGREGRLLTGQNPSSAAKIGKALVDQALKI
jgi:putative intracellular protease/amidase